MVLFVVVSSTASLGFCSCKEFWAGRVVVGLERMGGAEVLTHKSRSWPGISGEWTCRLREPKRVNAGGT